MPETRAGVWCGLPGLAGGRRCRPSAGLRTALPRRRAPAPRAEPLQLSSTHQVSPPGRLLPPVPIPRSHPRPITSECSGSPAGSLLLAGPRAPAATTPGRPGRAQPPHSTASSWRRDHATACRVSPPPARRGGRRAQIPGGARRSCCRRRRRYAGRACQCSMSAVPGGGPENTGGGRRRPAAPAPRAVQSRGRAGGSVDGHRVPAERPPDAGAGAGRATACRRPSPRFDGLNRCRLPAPPPLRAAGPRSFLSRSRPVQPPARDGHPRGAPGHSTGWRRFIAAVPRITVPARPAHQVRGLGQVRSAASFPPPYPDRLAVPRCIVRMI